MAGWNGGWVVATHQRMQEADPWTPKHPNPLPSSAEEYLLPKERRVEQDEQLQQPSKMTFAHYICIAVTSISHLSQQRRQQQPAGDVETEAKMQDPRIRGDGGGV